MQEKAIIAEFTQQAESFNRSSVATAQGTLDALVELASPAPGERWLDAACGPGIVCRRLAAHVAEVHGVDMTPAMIAVARREAAAAGLSNTSYAVGDATALELENGSMDGALARFTIHHVPVPGRVVGELARVVRPGGRVVLADHLADEDADDAAFAQELERLRDPSHWASLPIHRLRSLGAEAGLELERERVLTISLDFDDWLERGLAGAAAREQIEHALAARPQGTECFRIGVDGGGGRTLGLRMWLSRWRR